MDLLMHNDSGLLMMDGSNKLYFLPEATTTTTTIGVTTTTTTAAPATGYSFPFTTSGSGTGYSRLQVAVSSNTYARMSGTGHFTDYTGAADYGNVLFVNGSIYPQSLYVIVPSGTSNLSVDNGLSLITAVTGYQRPTTDSPTLYNMDVSILPTHILVFRIENYPHYVYGTISSVPSSLQSLRYGISGTAYVSCNLNLIPDACIDLMITNSTADSRSFSGNLYDLPNDITQLRLVNCGTITYGTSKSWTNALQYDFYIKPRTGGGMIAAQINQLLIDLEASFVYNYAKIIDLRGANAAPTGAGITAKNALIAHGYTVYTN